MKRKFIKNQTGFTLIEMAIILVIVGILIGMGSGLIGPLIKSSKYRGSKDTLEAALTSIIGFSTINERIPTTSEFSSTVRMPNDSWGDPLIYISDSNLIDKTAGGVCGRKTTGISVLLCPDAVCASPTETINNVAFVVLSKGENKNRQTEISGGGAVTVYSIDIPNIDDYTTDMDRPEPYDDLASWLTLNELRVKSGCQGTQLKILNNELPFGNEDSTYTANVYADGGVPYSAAGKYRWCVEGSLPEDVTLSPTTTSANCVGLSEVSWGQADTLAFGGTPDNDGSYNITVFARDDNDPVSSDDNIADKSFVITINPGGLPQCSDGLDNDGDGDIDMDDHDCSSPTDDSEEDLPECSDGEDNDGDGDIDMADDDCSSPTDDDEDPPQCSDGEDNDDDGDIDMDDDDCSSPTDDSEDSH